MERPDTLSDDQHQALIEAVERAMPVDGPIGDLRDWDVQLRDELGEDWFFDAALGSDDASIAACADDLTATLLDVVERYALDYNQHEDPDAFERWISEEALLFIRNWRLQVQASRNIIDLLGSSGPAR